MVDPLNLTRYDRTVPELEEMALFSVLVAGKNALTTARLLDDFLGHVHGRYQPFRALRQFREDQLSESLWGHGFGCYKMKGRAVHELVNSDLCLKTCTVEDLEGVHGIGPKTARMYVMHSRRNQQVAALDVHILRYLGDCGYDVPRVTPGSKKQYARVEQLFLAEARKAKQAPADFDLMLWKKYSGRLAS